MRSRVPKVTKQVGPHLALTADASWTGPGYEKPSVADYGDLAGFTAGACPGPRQDASYEANPRFHVGEFS